MIRYGIKSIMSKMDWTQIKNVIKSSKEHSIFILSTVLTSLAHFLFSIYVKMHIEPLEYGIYSTCLLLQTYMSYLQLGSLNAFNRDYSQLIGAKDNNKAKLYRDNVFTFIIITFLIAVLIICFGLLILHNTVSIDIKYILGFFLIAIITILTTIEHFGNYRVRIDKGFINVSIISLVELISFPIGIYMVKWTGYYGIYLTTIISLIIGIVLYSKSAYFDINFCIDREFLKKILRSGMPLLINGLVWTVVNSIDKFVILGCINTEALGIYSIAQTAFTYMILVPTSMSQLFYAKMGAIYGETKNKNDLTEKSEKFSFILAGLTSLMSLTAFFFLPIIVKTLMPGYVNGIHSAQILILGLSIYATTMISGNILTILRNNSAILRSSIYMCVFNIICSLLYVKLIGAYIEMVALGTATSYILCAFITIYQVNICTGCGLWTLIKSSIIPVFITVIPATIIYFNVDSKLLGYTFSLIIILSCSYIIHGKYVKALIQK